MESKSMFVLLKTWADIIPNRINSGYVELSRPETWIFTRFKKIQLLICLFADVESRKWP